MARAYCASLGCIALVICVIRGLLLGDQPEEILEQALGMLLPFAALGFVLGWTAELIIRQSVEENFRQAVQKLQEKQNS